MTTINDYNSGFDIVKTIASIQQAVNTIPNSGEVVDDAGEVVAADYDYSYNRIRSFYAPNAPTGLNMTTDVGTVWYETDNNNNATWWDGYTWRTLGTQRWHGGLGLESLGPALVTVGITSLRLYENTVPGSPAVYDMNYNTGTTVLQYWNGSAWVTVTDPYMKDAVADALNFGDIPPADTYIKIWYQSATPTAEGIGDLWYDSANDFAARRWDGSAWVAYGGDARTEVGFPPPQATAELRASVSALTVLITNADDADNTTYDYHMSTTSGFTPTTGTLVDSTLSTINVMTRDAAGMLLVPGQLYYIKVIARNPAGAALASTELSGQLDLTVNNQLIIDQVSTGFLLAGTIQIGGTNFILDADDGLIINQTDGSLIHFPRDGSPATITAHLIARSLLVENGANIQGESLLGGTIRLGADVENPSVAPTFTQDYETVKDLLPSIVGSVQNVLGPVRNLANNGWVVLVQAAWTDVITRYDVTDAGAVTSATVFSAGSGQLRGFTRSTTEYHVAVNDRIYRLSASWVVNAYRTLQGQVTEPIGVTGGSETYGLFFDGTNMRVCYLYMTNYADTVVTYDIKEAVFAANYTSGTTAVLSRTVIHSGYQQQTGYLPSPPYPSPYGPFFDYNIIGYYVGAADFGSTRYIVQFRLRGQRGAGFYHGVLTYSAPGVRTGTNDWQRLAGTGADVLEGGLWWDGTNFYGLATDFYQTPTALTVCKIIKMAARPASSTGTASYSWQNDAGTITTAQSPAASLALSPRTRYTVGAQAAPQADSVASDAANSIAIYVENTGVTRKQQTQLAIGVRSYTSGAITGGTTAPTSNGFAGIGTPGLIRSTKTDGSGPLVSLKGDGSGRVGPLSWDDDGVVLTGKIALAPDGTGRPWLSSAPVNGGNIALGINSGDVEIAKWSTQAPAAATRAFINAEVNARCPAGNQAVGYRLWYTVNAGTNWAELVTAYVHNHNDAFQALGVVLSGFVDFPAGLAVNQLQFRLLAATGGGAGNTNFGMINMHTTWFK